MNASVENARVRGALNSHRNTNVEKTNPIRLLIVDDHLVVRIGLRSMIDSQPDMEVVGEAADGCEALQRYRDKRPDVVLLDLRMPQLNGVEATAAIRKESPEALIIVLTTYDGDENIYRALQAGARAYLLKDIPRDEFLRAIRAVRSGEYCIPPAVAARLAHRLPHDELSTRELEVLKLIVEGMSNKEIASMLAITESTVKNHVNSILAKLRVKDRTQAATTALRRGIVVLG
jgi:DNA-binding NarL/FixJ family response regulator